MRTIIWIRIRFLMVGAFVVVALSGAFDVSNAEREREVGVEATSDENTFPSLEYPSEDRTLELNSNDADGGGGCFLGLYLPYTYNDMPIVVLEDNTPPSDLSIDEHDLQSILIMTISLVVKNLDTNRLTMDHALCSVIFSAHSRSLWQWRSTAS
ncbi:hypothetical protein C496_08826 [Natronorubrum tibetense GA33]|uniref:Uncharacterized protein n=1 Tax=Natronorubrum tibetense GA33 TaxID=1114856 RepID=L9VXY4_9EURY|nr:hypothetical protein C496_08826 [Natronorubrum tibetense GA33]